MNNIRFVTRVTCLFVCCATAVSLPISVGAETVLDKQTAQVKEAASAPAVVPPSGKTDSTTVQEMLAAQRFAQCREYLEHEKARLSASDYNYWLAKSWLKEEQSDELKKTEEAMKKAGDSFSSRGGKPTVEDMPPKLRNAMTSINLAIDASPKSANFYQLRSEIYSQWSMDVQAISDASKAIELEPKNGQQYLSRAAAWYAAFKIDLAEVAVCSDARLKERLLEIARLPDEKQHKAIMMKALDDINEAVRLNPKDAYCYCLRSKVIQSLGYRWKDVLNDQTRAIELDPKNARYYHDRAYTWQWLTPPDIKKALGDATKAVELEPGKASHREIRAMFLLQLKRWEALDAEYVVLDKMCDGFWYKQQKAEAKYAMGKVNEAVKIWESVTDSCASLVSAAYGCMSLGDLENAMKLCDRAIALKEGPKGPQLHAHWLKAQALRVIGDDTQALKEGKEALAMAKTAHGADLNLRPSCVPSVTEVEIEDFCNGLKRQKAGN